MKNHDKTSPGLYLSLFYISRVTMSALIASNLRTQNYISISFVTVNNNNRGSRVTRKTSGKIHLHVNVPGLGSRIRKEPHVLTGTGAAWKKRSRSRSNKKPGARAVLSFPHCLPVFILPSPFFSKSFPNNSLNTQYWNDPQSPEVDITTSFSDCLGLTKETRTIIVHRSEVFI